MKKTKYIYIYIYIFFFFAQRADLLYILSRENKARVKLSSRRRVANCNQNFGALRDMQYTRVTVSQ